MGLSSFRAAWKGFFAPGVPVHGVVGVLEEVGALLGEEAVRFEDSSDVPLPEIGVFCHGNLMNIMIDIFWPVFVDIVYCKQLYLAIKILRSRAEISLEKCVF